MVAVLVNVTIVGCLAFKVLAALQAKLVRTPRPHCD